MNDCCTIKKPAMEFTCPRTGTKGTPVKNQLVHFKVQGKYQHLIDSKQAYRFCNDADCEVVYFGDGGSLILKEHLAEPVGIKEFGKAPDYPVCHCFNFKKSDIQSEFEKSENFTIPTQISVYIKEQLCACEVRNPSGKCCLGFVNKVVKAVKANWSLYDIHGV
ncbi:MAG: hypothetical protein HY537_17600 [Deltaproteobacteria bacterium]|nr:hypothetical protein [Deltaproteobacteria bacterium]